MGRGQAPKLILKRGGRSTSTNHTHIRPWDRRSRAVGPARRKQGGVLGQSNAICRGLSPLSLCENGKLQSFRLPTFLTTTCTPPFPPAYSHRQRAQIGEILARVQIELSADLHGVAEAQDLSAQTEAADPLPPAAEPQGIRGLPGSAGRTWSPNSTTGPRDPRSRLS